MSIMNYVNDFVAKNFNFNIRYMVIVKLRNKQKDAYLRSALMGLAGKKSTTVISTINEVLAKLLIGMKL